MLHTFTSYLFLMPNLFADLTELFYFYAVQKKAAFLVTPSRILSVGSYLLQSVLLAVFLCSVATHILVDYMYRAECKACNELKRN
jgi:hypothetical protein